MLSLRVLRVAAPRLSARRYASSHGEPQYNEPSGWLFGEKVRIYANRYTKTILIPSPAASTRSETSKGGVGEHLVHRDVW